MRPVIRAGLRMVWRGPDTVQFGISRDFARTLHPVSAAMGDWLRGLDGVDTAEDALARAERMGLARGDAERALVALNAGGVLTDGATAPGPVHDVTIRERDRQAPDRASLGLAYPEPGVALAAVRARRTARVDIHGAGRVGSSVAALLAAAGIGCVSVHDERRVQTSDCTPGGFTYEDIGISRRQALERVVRTIAPSIETRPHRDERPVTIAVFADDMAQNHSDAEAYVRDGVAHLAVEVIEVHARIGPLVLPGASPCLRCVALHRTDRDAAWPAVAAQIVGVARPEDAGDVLLTTLAAAYAAAAVRAAIDKPHPPSSLSGRTLDIALPDLQLRHRTWSSHHACGCAWAQAA